jgi:hypothetical protein
MDACPVRIEFEFEFTQMQARGGKPPGNTTVIKSFRFFF